MKLTSLQKILPFLKSTTTVLVLSSLVGCSFFLMNDKFWPAFFITAAGQYILFSFIGQLILSSQTQVLRLKELEKIEQLSSILECAACKENNVITFIPDQNERIEFSCRNCNRKNSVVINFVVAAIPESTPSSVLKDVI